MTLGASRYRVVIQSVSLSLTSGIPAPVSLWAEPLRFHCRIIAGLLPCSTVLSGRLNGCAGPFLGTPRLIHLRFARSLLCRSIVVTWSLLRQLTRNWQYCVGQSQEHPLSTVLPLLRSSLRSCYVLLDVLTCHIDIILRV